MKPQANKIIISEYKAFTYIIGTLDLKLLPKVFVKVLFMFVLLLCFENSFAQFPPRQKGQQDFSPKVHYYPFYNGVQMIEIDRASAYHREVSFLEFSQPRALSWSMVLGPAPMNIYIFRNEQGQINKQFGDTEEVPEIHILDVAECRPLIRAHHHWQNRFEKLSIFSASLDYFPHYQIGSRFDDRNENGLGLIDSLGNVILEPEYQEIYADQEMFIVQKDGQFSLLDKFLNEKYTCKNCRLAFYSEYPQGILLMRKDLRGLMDFSGKLLIPCEYTMILPRFQEQGLAEVRLGGRIGLVKMNGEVVLPLKYQSMGDFTAGLLNCRKDDFWGYVNQYGETIIPHQFSIALNFKEGYAKVAIKKGGNYYFGFINTKGEIVVPLEYEKAEELDNGMVKVKPYGKDRWQTLELGN